MHKSRLEALQYLNLHYGRGDITEVREYADGRKVFIARLQYGTTKRTFHDDGKTVKACGHQARYGTQ